MMRDHNKMNLDYSKIPIIEARNNLPNYIIIQYNRGISLRNLSKELNISRPTIVSILKKNSISIKNKPSIKLTEQDKTKILTLATTGKTVKQIANLCQVNENQVTTLFAKYNIYNRKIDRKSIKGIKLNLLNRSFASPKQLEQYLIDNYKIKSASSIARDLGIKDHHRICNILKNNNIILVRSRRKYIVNDVYFETIDSHEKAYILGFIFADGCIYTNNNEHKLCINLALKDKNHLELINEKMGSNYPIRIFSSTGGLGIGPKWQCSVQINSSQLTNSLIDKGAVPRKSLILDWPKNVPSEFLNSFLLGYVDGDGWWTGSINIKGVIKPTLGLCGGSSIFLDKCSNYLAKQLNIKKAMVFSRIRKNSKSYQIAYSSLEDCRQLFAFLYKDNQLFLNRKYDRINKILQEI